MVNIMITSMVLILMMMMSLTMMIKRKIITTKMIMLLTILTIYASSVGLAENIIIAVFRISGQR